MATVRPLRQPAQRTLADAISTYLTVGLAGREHDGTRRVYAGVLRRLAARFGDDSPAAALDADEVAEWFIGEWGERRPATWNVSLDVIRAAGLYWREQGWTSPDPAADPAARLRRRRTAPDRDRALSRAEVERLLTSEKHPLRERLLWRLLYESAARSAEVLRLDVPDLDMPNRRARVRRKGGAVDVVVWQTGTARLLPRYLAGRKTGPLFVTERRSRLELSPADLDERGRARLSYEQAEQLFKAAAKGATLHQLRHSALSHDAEAGTSTPMLMARSGHTSVRSLAKYARVSPEALARHQAETRPRTTRLTRAPVAFGRPA